MGKKRVVQWHHLSYKPEWKVAMWRMEHYYIMKIDRHTKDVTEGFLTALEHYILKHRSKAVKAEELEK